MLKSLNTGTTGVTSHANALSVTGSNIANVNTHGYKTHRAQFADLFATSTGAINHKQMGHGSVLEAIKTIHTQGSMESTELTTDLAIDGQGFFVIQDQATNRNFYSRAGNFQVNEEGILSNKSGYQVLVKDVDPITNESIGQLKNIKLLDIIDPPKATGDGTDPRTGVFVKANLSSDAQVPDVAINLDNISKEMYNFSTSVEVFDQLGNAHELNVIFRRKPDTPISFDPVTGLPIPNTGSTNQWEWYVTASGDELNGGLSGIEQAIGGGFLEFSNDGRLIQSTIGRIAQPAPQNQPGTAQEGQVQPAPLALAPKVLLPIAEQAPTSSKQIAINFNNNPSTSLIGFNFGEGFNPLSPNKDKNGLDGITSFAGKSALHNVSADGNAFGEMTSFDIDNEGTITALFSSGSQRALGRIAIADFNSQESLEELGRNLYTETKNSGQAIISHALSGGRGAIRSKNLEKANVDIAKEMVDMIQYQRGLQANAKTITTSDEMLAELIQLKR